MYAATKKAARLRLLLLRLSPPSAAPLRRTKSTFNLHRLLYSTVTSSTSSHRLLQRPPTQAITPFSTLWPTLWPTPSTHSLVTEETDTEAEAGEQWEEKEKVEPVIGDGGDGGGVALQDVPWGERALSAAREVLELELFGDDDLALYGFKVNFPPKQSKYGFKVNPEGHVYLRLDKLTHKYGCPSMYEIEKFNRLYNQRLEWIIEIGEIPINLAIEVSTPGAKRLLKVPQDLDRFKDVPMRVQYLEVAEDGVSKHPQQREKVFMLDLIDTEGEHCVWKLANVKENRVDLRGSSLSKKQRDWRLTLPFALTKRIMLYLDSILYSAIK